MVPGQRPPARQGLLLVRGHGAEHLRGGRQRLPAWRRRPRLVDHLELGRARADGVLSGDDRHRVLGCDQVADGLRYPGLRRGRFGAHGRAAGSDRLVVGPPGRGARPAQQCVRPLSVQHRGRDRRQPGRPLLRTRDTDPPRLLEALLARQRRQPGERRRRRRPRARTPVVRRQRRGRALEGHLAERGLRDLRRVAVGRARGSGDPGGDLPGHLRPDPRRRPAVVGRDRRPGRRPAVRQRGLRARRDDPAGAAKQGRRQRVLPHPAQVGGDEERRQRPDRGVHGARGEHLRRRGLSPPRPACPVRGASSTSPSPGSCPA